MRTSLMTLRTLRTLLMIALAATVLASGALTLTLTLTPTSAWAARAKSSDEGDASAAKSAKSKKARTARASSKRAGVSQAEAKQRRLGTDFNFSDAQVRGKYHSAGEGLVTVEDEKSLVDLLGVRRHFKDRLQADTTRN
jgi:hypothetical protein